jgi:DMSO/TMAO reductase YedYZ molybdopterin-dependent catalytic subunit
MTTHPDDLIAVTEVDPDAPVAPVAERPLPPRAWGAVAGLAAGGAAIAVGMLVAALTGSVSPIDAVGSSFIDRTPAWLKDLAIEWFGTDDKLALRVGIIVIMAIAAACFGIASRRRLSVGVLGIALFGLVGFLAVAERPGAGAGALLAPIVGSAVGIGVLWWLMQILHGRWLREITPGPSQAPLGWDRRRFLAASGGVAAGAVVVGTLARREDQRQIAELESVAPDSLPPVAAAPAAAAALVPAGADVVPGTPYITPIDDFYRIDTALSFPRVDVRSWNLRIHGMVDNEISLSYDDIAAMPQVERIVTLCCVSNPVGGPYIGNARWQGVMLADVLEMAGVQPGAEQVFSTSVDGWTCGFPTSVALDGRDCMIAIGMNGEPLPVKNGFPARLVIPGLYGYVSATKWLSDIELTTWDAKEGYWIPRGWSRDAPIKTHSRIDVPRQGESLPAGTTPIAGVAWAQHRGIERVEVRIDDGDWIEAELGDDVTDDSWRQWIVQWDATEGDHRIQVRATDKTGETQTEMVTPVAPDGATGYHTRRVRIT